jgi:protein ImuB
LKEPQRIEVSAPIPDYPPMNFRYKDKLHKVKKQMPAKELKLNGG